VPDETDDRPGVVAGCGGAVVGRGDGFATRPHSRPALAEGILGQLRGSLHSP
jgi:hypothetical protein